MGNQIFPKLEFNPPSPLSLQLGSKQKHKTTVYRYFLFFVIFIVVYSPVLAPILILLVLLKSIHSPYAEAVHDKGKTESYEHDSSLWCSH